MFQKRFGAVLKFDSQKVWMQIFHSDAKFFIVETKIEDGKINAHRNQSIAGTKVLLFLNLSRFSLHFLESIALLLFFLSVVSKCAWAK